MNPATGDVDRAWDAAVAIGDASQRRKLARDLRDRATALRLLGRLRTEERLRLALARRPRTRARWAIAAAALLAAGSGAWWMVPAPGHAPAPDPAVAASPAVDGSEEDGPGTDDAEGPEPLDLPRVAAGDHRLPDGSLLTAPAQADCALRWDVAGTRLSVRQGRIICAVIPQEPGRRFVVSSPEMEIVADDARFAVRRRGSTTRVVPGDRTLTVRDRGTGALLAVAVGERADFSLHCDPVKSAAKTEDMP